ncbi:MAG: hypothetical protein KGD63_03605 [Candidatus Lokiarchaeota archaeon]|nr:hypothetical protein [Candidatus Lokiarchaeota archaeon]
MTTNFNPETHLLPCPFSISCILPKSGSICKFPSYKECSEYHFKTKKIKTHLIY